MKRAFLDFFAALCSRSKGNRRGYLVCSAPVPERNRGDQAMLEVVTEHLLRNSTEPIRVLTTSSHPVETLKPNSRIVIDTTLAPAFYTNHSFREQLRFIRIANRYRGMLVIGADVLDEGYSVERSQASIHMLKLASSMGLMTRIFGFSVNSVPSAGLAQRLSQLKGKTTLCVRDPVSLERLSSARIPGCVPVGDLAYLLEPREPGDAFLGIKDYIKKNRDRLIGLNLTRDVVKNYGQESAVLDRFCDAVKRVVTELDARILLIPHDEPEGLDYLTDFRKRVGLSSEYIDLVSPLPHSSELKWIAGQLRHLFTCRLHLGIAAMGMGTAVTGFPYQGKFEGQFDIFGLSRDGLITAERFPSGSEGLFKLFRDRIEQSDHLSAQIRGRFGAVRETCLKNFDQI